MADIRVRVVGAGSAGYNEFESITLTEFLDALIGTDLGTTLYRGASGWTALAPPTADGQLLVSSGGVPTWLAAGTDGKVLTGATGDVPTWV